MNSAIGVVIVLLILGVLFFLLGHCFCGVFQREERLPFQLLIGAVLFFSIFSVIELPVEKLHLPFHMLVYLELGAFAAVFLWCIRFCVKEGMFGRDRAWEKPDTVALVFLLLVALQVIYGMNNGVRINGFDTSYYNGHAINALYTDTMYQYSPRSGEFMGYESYVHDGYPMLIAFLSKIFWMHPLVMGNRVLACVEIILMNLIVYEIAYRLSNGNRRIGNWTVGLHAGISIFCYQFDEGRGFYLWQRTAESKSMLANLYLPLALLALILLAKEMGKRYCWVILALVFFAGASLSISGIFILCVMIGGGLLALLFYQRRWQYWIGSVLCMLPGMLAGIIRLLL
ncbi:MAG: DUF6077 domain-containing protein [Roseburia sp.]